MNLRTCERANVRTSVLRFAAVLSHPIQHYSPVFRELAKQPGIRVRVLYLCDYGVRESYDPGFGVSYAWNVPLLGGYEHEFLRPGFSPVAFSFREMDSSRLSERLDDYRPHAIWVHGYGQRLSWRAVKWARRNGAAVLYFGDSELLHRRPLASQLLKKLALPLFFGRCDAFITAGDNNEAYYRHYRVPHSKLFRGSCPIEVARFRDAVGRRADRDAIRAQWGVPANAFVVVLSGKLQPYKRPGDLIEAVGLLRAIKDRPIHALLLGDGPMRGDLMKQSHRVGVADRVHVTGFINQSEIPSVLASCDVLAVTSERDAHPLSVAEALAVGLPVVCSDRVGCVGPTDSARPGVTALVYPCGDVRRLADAIVTLARDDGLYRQLADNAERVADEQDVSVTVSAIVRALASLRPSFASDWRNAGDEFFERGALASLKFHPSSLSSEG
jgi:glycosyltransferase involved in cell wall biosynthesis